ncbi:hypothetical protein ACIGNX_24415 [Actinosynnema sp. NPDC053489]|uniref:LppU/SCO3897 family protein n=1 Tax=Actinosynnema sp. NPDC053489 TaxID=3363916 RepID=UPI0037C8AF66
MSNEPSRPADDVPTGGDPSARPDVPPADAERIAAAREAAASAGQQQLSTPASTGLGGGGADAEPAPEAGGAARDQAVSGNEPITPAGPAAVPGARPTPDDDPAANPRRDGRRILIAVLVLVLLGIIAFGVWSLTRGGSHAEAGDCVSVSAQQDDRADVETQDCSTDQASFKVGKVLDASDATCPEDGLYTEIVPTDDAGDGYKLCLLPNMVEGGCYKADEGTGFVKTACSGPETIKVTKVVKGSADLAACPDGAGMAYPEPAVTYCLEPAEM